MDSLLAAYPPALQTIISLDERFMSNGEEDVVLQRACDDLHTRAGYRLAWIGYGETDGRMRCIGKAGAVEALSDAGLRWDAPARDLPPSGRCYSSGRPVDFQSAGETGAVGWRDALTGHGITTVFSCPLAVHGRVIGVLTVGNDAPLSEIDRTLVRTTARHITYHLEMRRDARARSANDRQLQLAATVFDNAREGIMITDASGSILAVNNAVSEVTGYTRAELLGQNPRLLSSGRQDAAFYAQMWRTIEKTGQWKGEIWNKRKNGEIYAEWLSLVSIRQAGGEVKNYVAIFSDITEQKRNEEHLNYLAFHDPLTGLPNRVHYHERLQQTLSLAQRDKCRAALLYIDLDRFKHINDTFGHATGDLLLQAVASRLVGCVKEGDTVARLGGDEFTAVLHGIREVQDAARVAERVLGQLGAPYLLEGKEMFVTPSIGIAIFPDDADMPENLSRCADAAMYRSKKSGRNHYQFYTEDMNAATNRQATLERFLHRALERDELHLHYQPQVDTAGRRIIGMEALMRWRQPQLGDISPGEFIPVAEETGLITAMGAWCLRGALAQLSRWRAMGHDTLTMAVNVSAVQFHDPGFVASVAEALREADVPARFLELELTESIAMQAVPNTRTVLAQLKALGVRVAIDDFGTGYSALSYLKTFAFDTLKIDRSFVSGIGRDRNDAAIIRAILTLAHSLELRTVAEGVEEPAQADFLAAHRCDEIQGFLFYRPADAQACTDWLQASRDGRLPD